MQRSGEYINNLGIFTLQQKKTNCFMLSFLKKKKHRACATEKANGQ